MTRFISALILIALILVFSAFAIINRTMIEVHFDFWTLIGGVGTGLESESGNSFFVFEVPLYIIAFISGLIGMFVGMLLPLMNFFRKKRLAFQHKMRQPIKAPPIVAAPAKPQSSIDIA